MRVATRFYLAVCLTLIVVTLAAQAEIPNGSFETGDFTSWTATGTAFSIDVPGTVGAFNNPDGSYYASSFAADGLGGATGTLRSNNFVLDKNTVEFLITGWSTLAPPPGKPKTNYVTLNLASNNLELDREYAPNTPGVFISLLLSGGDHTGESVYLAVVDDNPGGSGAYIAVDAFKTIHIEPLPLLQLIDDFEPIPTPPPAPQIPNGNFETGDFTSWTVTGNVFSIDVPGTVGAFNNPEGAYYASSFPQEALMEMGTLRSSTFVLNKRNVEFLITGWSTFTPNSLGESPTNYVTLNLASDSTELDRLYAPNTPGVFGRTFLSGAEHVGEEVYVEVVDNNDAPMGAYIAVDDFRTGDRADLFNQAIWSVTGEAWSVGTSPWHPVLQGTTSATSAAAGGADAQKIGRLTSVPITVPTGAEGLALMLAGFDGTTDTQGYGVEPDVNYVDVFLNKNPLTKITRVYPPGGAVGHPAVDRVIDMTPYVGQQIIIDVVDNSGVEAGTFNTWMAVDFIRFVGEGGTAVRNWDLY